MLVWVLPKDLTPGICQFLAPFCAGPLVLPLLRIKLRTGNAKDVGLGVVMLVLALTLIASSYA